MAWVKGKSGTYNISTKNSYISGYVKWEEQYDVTTNKSLVSQTAYLHRTNIYSGETYFKSGTVSRTAYFGSETVATSVVTDMSIPGNSSSSGGSYVQVYTASKEIAHNSDGSKSITLGFAMSNNISGVAGDSFTVPKTTATVALTTIPRATIPSLSATSVTMGSTMRITLTPADSSFKHKIRYEFGSLVSQVDGLTSGTGFTSQGTTYHDFTPPTALGSQIPNATSGTAKLIVYTYKSDGTHVGTQTVNLTINVPSYTPTISNIALTGNSLLSGMYVQGKSTVKAVITASSSYGATIKSISSTVDGKTYTGSSFTSSALSNGSKSVSVTVTDTRGKTTTKTSDAFTVYVYSAPSITSFTLTRQSDETTVIATVKGSVSSVNNENFKNTKVVFSLPGKDAITKTITSGTVNLTATFTDVDTDSTLTGTAKITDSYTSATKETVLPTVAVTMDFHSSGKGIALGKVAELANLFEVAWKSAFNKAVSIKDDALATLTLKRNHTYNGAAIKFENDKAVLGYVGMYGESTNRSLRRWTSDTISSYIVLDSGNLTETIKDYVVAQGTSNGWEYTKWNSGKIELFATKNLSFADGAKQADNLYRSIVQIDLSSLLTNIMSGTCGVQVNGMVPQVCRHSSTHTLAEIVIVTSRTFSAFTLSEAPIYIIGKWK